MKYILFAAVVMISSLSAANSTINPIIGDASLTILGNVEKDKLTENERIKLHLAYAENLLRNKATDHLSEGLKERRLRFLDHLRDYWLRAMFPVNTVYKNQRKPCFKDELETLCAVGYLVEQSEGIETVDLINENFQFQEIMEMELAELEKWILTSGFTKKEIATIQPTYEWRNLNRRMFGVHYGPSFLGNHVGSTITLSRFYAYGEGNLKCTPAVRGTSVSAIFLRNSDRFFELTGFYSLRFSNQIAVKFGVSPTLLSSSEGFGIGFKPDIGIKRMFDIGNLIGIVFDANYGYNFSIAGIESDDYSRYMFSTKLGIAVNLNNF